MFHFKRDFELMCTNAMTYNTNDTIYYKSAKKLLGYGRKILSAEKILPLRGHLPFITTISIDEFGFDINLCQYLNHNPNVDIINPDDATIL